MRYLLYLLSAAGLMLTIVPPVLNFKGLMLPSQQNLLMGIGFVLWFGSAWFWLGKRSRSNNQSTE